MECFFLCNLRIIALIAFSKIFNGNSDVYTEVIQIRDFKEIIKLGCDIIGKFDLNKFEGILGIGFFGGVIACFINVMISSIIAGFEDALPEVVETMNKFKFYNVITGFILLAFGILLLAINTYRTRFSEAAGTRTFYVFIVVITTVIVICIATLLPSLIF